ncbi:MAG: Lrp/AsnC family transcriptional regulator [Clostridia bacterium]|nr:Lrp/AsnC family transcriptional regulator [Clostridia bacterium]
MDNTDIRIINALSENARISASELSDRVNLSVSAVIERIRKLENAGMIKQYTTILDEKQFGLDVTAFICILMDHPRYNEQLTEFAKRKSAIVECHYVAGDYDYLLKIRTHSTSSLERLLDEVKSVPGVGRTKTLLVLSTAKQVHSPKIRENNNTDKREEKLL